MEICKQLINHYKSIKNKFMETKESLNNAVKEAKEMLKSDWMKQIADSANTIGQQCQEGDYKAFIMFGIDVNGEIEKTEKSETTPRAIVGRYGGSYGDIHELLYKLFENDKSLKIAAEIALFRVNMKRSRGGDLLGMLDILEDLIK
jgi:hypothetical protein